MKIERVVGNRSNNCYEGKIYYLNKRGSLIFYHFLPSTVFEILYKKSH